MECPAEKMRKDDSYRRIMLVAAGSAMAANCEPCLNMVVPNLIEAGVPDGEIRRAVEIGQYVKDREAGIMKEAADVLAGTGFLDKEVSGEHVRAELDILELDRVGLLIAVGASVAGNCESCLNAAVRKLKDEGVTTEEMRGAMEIGQAVKERPVAIMKETTARLVGSPAEPSPPL